MALSGSLNFITASGYGSAGTSFRTMQRQDQSAQGDNFVPTDFVGLNINIKEPITASQNLLGHASEVALHGDRIGSSAAHSANTEYTPKYGSEPRAPFIRRTDATMFNTLMLHRNGPYGFPTWKQVRTGEHPVARYLRTHNTTSFTTPHHEYKGMYDFSMDDRPPILVDPENPTADDFEKWEHNIIMNTALQGEKNYPIVSQFYEPAVVSRHKPIDMRMWGQSLDLNPMKAVGRYTLFNNVQYFTNWAANFRLKIPNLDPATGSSVYSEQRNVLLSMLENESITDISFTETIFPREVNTYRGLTRDRQNYDETAGAGLFDNGYDKRLHRTFWRDSSSDRVRTDGTSLNSQGYLQRFGFDATKPPGGTSNGSDGQLTDGAMILNAGFYFNHGSSSYVTNGVVSNQVQSYDPMTADDGDKATAAIRASDGTAAHGLTAGQKITLTSTEQS